MIIHQIFFDIGKGKSIKAFPNWEKNVAVNKKLNPTFRHILWTDKTAQTFINKHYPQYKPMINSFPHKFYLIDFFRYLVLAKMGGVYIDLDVRCKKAIPKDATTIIGSSYTRVNINNNVIRLPPDEAQGLLDFSVSEYKRIKDKGLFKGKPGRHFLNSISMKMFERFVKKKGLTSDINFKTYFYDEEAGSWIGDKGIIKKDYITKTNKGKPPE